MGVSAVIAAKNEGRSIRYVVSETRRYVDECIVVIPVDDAETRTSLIDLDCTVITESARGKGSALVTGADFAREDILVFIDADLSHDPSDIPKLVAPIINGDCDHVVASRMLGGSSELFNSLPNFVRLLGSHIITLAINKKYGSSLTDSQNGYRAIRRQVFKTIDPCERHTTIEQELTAKTLSLGYRMIEIPSHEYARVFGESKIRVFRHGFRYVIVLITIMVSKKSGKVDQITTQSIQKRYQRVWYSIF